MRLRDDFRMWIDLHLNERVSGVLLILGHRFEFDRKPGEEGTSRAAVVCRQRSIEHMLSGLPDNLVRPVL